MAERGTEIEMVAIAGPSSAPAVVPADSAPASTPTPTPGPPPAGTPSRSASVTSKSPTRKELSVTGPNGIITMPQTIFEAQHSSGCSHRAEVIRVINGTWENRHATYVGLLVTHDDPRLIDESQVTVSIKSMDRLRTATIVRFAPKDLYGKPIGVEHNQSLEFNGGITASGGLPVGANAGSRFVDGKISTVEEREQVMCCTRPKPGEPGRSQLVLTATQNEARDKGLFWKQLPIGMIITQQGQPFSVTVNVVLDRKFRGRLTTKIVKSYRYTYETLFDGKRDWKRDGEAERARDFKDWNAELWAELVHYPGEYVNNLTGDE